MFVVVDRATKTKAEERYNTRFVLDRWRARVNVPSPLLDVVCIILRVQRCFSPSVVMVYRRAGGGELPREQCGEDQRYMANVTQQVF